MGAEQTAQELHLIQRGKLLSTGVADFRGLDGKSLIFHRGEGSEVIDSHHRSYLDFVLGFGPVVLGHAHPRFIEKMGSFSNEAIHFPGYSYRHYEYAERFLACLPATWSLALYKQSSDSVLAAIRLANAVAGRRGVIRCGFLGWHDIQLADSPSWHEAPASPFRTRRKAHRAFFPLASSDKMYDWLSLDVEILAIELERCPGAYSAFVIDLFQLAYCSPVEVTKAVALVRRHGALVVYDETKTGGRHGEQCAYLRLGLPQPDMIVLGKAIGNGAPLSVLAMRPDLATAFAEIRAGGTHSKELTAIFAGLATLDVMSETGGYEALGKAATRCVDALNMGLAHGGLTQLLTMRTFSDTLLVPELAGALLETPRLRERLQRHFAEHGLLIRLGHPAFVSVAHLGVSVDEIAHRASAAACGFRQATGI